MTQRDVLEVLEVLDRSAIRSCPDGGWGVDALLGEVTRRNADLDVVIALDDVPRIIELMAAVGFPLVRGVPESTFVLRDQRGAEVDVIRGPIRLLGQRRVPDGQRPGLDPRGRRIWRQRASRLPSRQVPDGRGPDDHHATGYEPGPPDFADGCPTSVLPDAAPAV